MPDTRTTITVGAASLDATEIGRVQSVTLQEALGERTKVSVVVAMDPGTRSTWTSPLDTLVAPKKTFGVTITRGEGSVEVDARSVSASWAFVPGGLSTLKVEGVDRSIELDLVHVQKPWPDVRDSEIAQTIFGEHGLSTQVESTPAGADSDSFVPQQDETDWEFLKKLAGRNGFDLYVESVSGVPTGKFHWINVEAPTQARLRLGYGEDGGNAKASVQLLAGQEVHMTRTIPGSATTDVATDDGKGHPMGTRSLGGVAHVRRRTAAGITVVDARTAARVMAERSAFGASLEAKLTAPDTPLIRARRTIAVAGLGEALDGPWLVKLVRHTVTPAGHTQEIELTRNALGDPDAGSGASGLAALTGGIL